MKIKTYTPDQWAAIVPALGHMTGRGIEIARRVLVDGVKGVDVANEFGTTPQNVSQMVRKARQALENDKAEGMVPTVIWLPQELADHLATLSREQIIAAISQTKA